MQLDHVYELYHSIKATKSGEYIKSRTKSEYKYLIEEHAYVAAFKENSVVGIAFLYKGVPEYLSGCIDLIPCDDPVGVVISLMVSPEHQGQGIAKKLISSRLALAKDLGIQHLYSSVHPKNKRNTSSIEKLGMHCIGACALHQTQSQRNIFYINLKS